MEKVFDLHMLGAKYHKEIVPPQCVGLRFFNIYGPNEYHKGDNKSMPLKVFEQATRGLPVKLYKSQNNMYGDGEQRRDFMYVKDAVNILEWLIEASNVDGVFNAGTGKSRTFNELAKIVFRVLLREIDIKYIDMPTKQAKQYQYESKADIKRLRKEGYDLPFFSLEEGIEDYIARFLSNSDRYI